MWRGDCGGLGCADVQKSGVLLPLGGGELFVQSTCRESSGLHNLEHTEHAAPEHVNSSASNIHSLLTNLFTTVSVNCHNKLESCVCQAAPVHQTSLYPCSSFSCL